VAINSATTGLPVLIQLPITQPPDCRMWRMFFTRLTTALLLTNAGNDTNHYTDYHRL
jgi:hypothetical protein